MNEQDPSKNIIIKDSNQNAAADRYLIFEKAALDKLRSQTDQSKPVGFLPLRVRLAALTAIFITASGIIWSVYARIPIQVNGQATIIPEGVISSILTRTNGIVYYQVNGKTTNQSTPSQSSRNHALSSFWGKYVVNSAGMLSINELMRLSAFALAEPLGQTLATSALDINKYQKKQINLVDNQIFIPSDAIIAIIFSPSSVEELDLAQRTIISELNLNSDTSSDRLKRATLYGEIDPLFGKQLVDRKKELADRQELLNRLKVLWGKGYISTAQLLSENATVNNLRQQVVQIDRDRIGNGFSKNDQSEQAKKAQLNSLQSISKLQDAIISFMAKTFAISPRPGIYVVAKYIRNGMQVNAGDELLTYTHTPPVLPKRIPVFVDAPTVQQLSKGMEVLVTPKGISRAEFGGIPGVIEEVGRLPIYSEGLASVAGGRSLANSISKLVPNPYMIKITLKQTNNYNCAQQISKLCYKWSSNRIPPFPVRIGSQADVQITTIYKHPIEFVMPALRKALGLVTDS